MPMNCTFCKIILIYFTTFAISAQEKGASPPKELAPYILPKSYSYLLIASCTATATATVMPTMGLLPAPMRPIMST